MARLASLVGITERETGVGKLGWHGNSTGFDRIKNNPINAISTSAILDFLAI